MRTLWRHLALVNLVSFLAQAVQIGTVPPALALQLKSAGAGSASIGLVASAPWIAILLAGRYVPRLLDRVGFLRTALAGLVMSGLPLIGMTLTSDPRALFGLNLVFGIGLILRWIACDTWIAAIAPAEIRGRAIGTHETFMGCGIATGPIVLAVGSHPLLVCIGLLAMSGLSLLALRNASVQPHAAQFVEPVRDRPFAMQALIAAGALAGSAETSAISFLPLAAQQETWALGAAAALFGFGLGGTLLQVPVGWLADRAGDRAAQLLVGLVVLGGALAIPFCTTHAVLLGLVLFCWGGAVGGANTLAVIEASKHRQARAVSLAMTAIALAYTVGSIVGPVLVGALQLVWPRFGLSTMVVVAAGLFLLLRTHRKM